MVISSREKRGALSGKTGTDSVGAASFRGRDENMQRPSGAVTGEGRWG
jgi:hypothetical protein